MGLDEVGEFVDSLVWAAYRPGDHYRGWLNITLRGGLEARMGGYWGKPITHLYRKEDWGTDHCDWDADGPGMPLRRNKKE